MNRRQGIVSLAAAATLGLASLVAAAAPAQAATQSFSVDCSSGGSVQSVTAATGDTITLTVSAGTCGYVSVANDLIASTRSNVTITGGGSLTLGPTPSSTYLDWTGDGTAITQVVITLNISGSGQINFNTGSPSWTGQAFNVTSGGGGGGGSSSGSSRAAPATVDVNLGLGADDGSVTSSWTAPTVLGTWKQLPESTNVVGDGDNLGKVFLGVATTEDFPVEIAQRQIDNGWGAYEIYSDDGRLSSVFIPAGGWAHVTAQPRLFPVWSD